MCVYAVTLNDDEDKQEKALSQLYDTMPDGRAPLEILRKKQERRHIGETLHTTTLLQETSQHVFLQIKCSIHYLTMDILLSHLHHKCDSINC